MAKDRLSNEAMREIASLAGLPRAALVAQWVDLFGREPPKRLTADLLARGLAYELQASWLGGLGRKEEKDLLVTAAGQPRAIPVRPSNGTRLYRTWHGTTQEVLVSESGYCWKGKTYSSLSQVARAITGTRWSGPKFFGVKA